METRLNRRKFLVYGSATLVTSMLLKACGNDLQSESGIDYTRLRDLLKTGQWREADKETYELMISAVGKEPSDPHFTSDELLNFPCTDLRTIDGLWIKYSQGKFGFSVQRDIYIASGGRLDGEYSLDETTEAWWQFSRRVGWLVQMQEVNYSRSQKSQVTIQK